MSDERTEDRAGGVATQPAASEVPPATAAAPGRRGNGAPTGVSPARTAGLRVVAAGGEVPEETERLPMSLEFEKTLRPLQEGDVIRGFVVHIDREGVLVDVGMKSEGLIPPNELSREHGRAAAAAVQVGDPIDVYVLNTDDEDGQLILSKKRADFEKAWDRVIESHGDGATLQAMVTDRVKGGLVVDLGIRGFVPASHVGTGKSRNLEKYVGMTLPLKVIEVDRDRRKVVLSHRLATEEERQAQKQETLSTLAEGQVRAGVVRRITDYGAFVDIGGVDGLLHISEMSWSRIKHPSDVLKVGDEIQVMVLKTNLEQERISLGLRQILPDPWTEAADKYHPGDLVQGTVTRLVPFGAFVQLDGGIEGIVPNNELAHRRVAKPEDVVQVGDHVQVKLLDLRPEERRMTLSLRQAQEDGDFAGFEQGSGGGGGEGRVTLGDKFGKLLEEEDYEDDEEWSFSDPTITSPATEL